MKKFVAVAGALMVFGLSGAPALAAPGNGHGNGHGNGNGGSGTPPGYSAPPIGSPLDGSPAGGDVNPIVEVTLHRCPSTGVGAGAGTGAGGSAGASASAGSTAGAGCQGNLIDTGQGPLIDTGRAPDLSDSNVRLWIEGGLWILAITGGVIAVYPARQH